MPEPSISKKTNCLNSKPVSGTSMLPAIFPNASIVFQYVSPDSISIGDIICYSYDSRTMVAHRVVGIKRTDGRRIFSIKGDAQNCITDIEDSAIAGVAKFVSQPFFSYKTSGKLGRFYAGIAISERYRWKIFNLFAVETSAILVKIWRKIIR